MDDIKDKVIFILIVLAIAFAIAIPFVEIVRHYDPADPAKLLQRIEALEKRIEFLEVQTGGKA